MLRLIGKILGGAAAAAVSTYLGKKFLDWTGVTKASKAKLKHDISKDV